MHTSACAWRRRRYSGRALCCCAVLTDSTDAYNACSLTRKGLVVFGRYQDKQNQLHKAVQDMYPPGACIFLRRLKAKIVRKERKKAEREARKREERERRDIDRQEKTERKVRLCARYTFPAVLVDAAMGAQQMIPAGHEHRDTQIRCGFCRCGKAYMPMKAAKAPASLSKTTPD